MKNEFCVNCKHYNNYPLGASLFNKGLFLHRHGNHVCMVKATKSFNDITGKPIYSNVYSCYQIRDDYGCGCKYFEAKKNNYILYGFLAFVLVLVLVLISFLMFI